MTRDARDDVRAVPVALSGIRRRLDGARGRAYWQSLEELAGDPAVEEMLRREFPEQASMFDDPLGRRQFMTLMGASLALAGLTGCTRQPVEKVVPYVKPPEGVVPGRPLFFATAVLDGGYAKGVLVESHLGRPTKIEGNPDHPTSLGATDARGQASILDLYDPDRLQTLMQLGQILPWGSFLASMKSALDAQRPAQGAGIRLLTETVTSPTLAAQIKELLTEFPGAKWHQWEAAGRDAARAGAVAALGRPMDTRYRLDADVVVCLDADFVTDGAANLRSIREFTTRRKLEGDHKQMNRLYAVECTPTLAGALADHRLPLRPSEVEEFTKALAAAVGAGAPAGSASATGPERAAWIAALAKDLQAHAGSSVVIPGDYQPPAVHALSHAINAKLGNVGKTVLYAAPAEANPVDQLASLRDLAADMDRGAVSMLIVLGGNPVFTAPADLDFAGRMDKVPLRVHLGLHHDETAERCHWQIPQAHFLESWSDARAVDGTVTILQPLIAPLYPAAKSAHEVLAALSSRPERSGYDIVREHWSTQGMGGDFETAWKRALHDGLVAAASAAAVPAGTTGPAGGETLAAAPAANSGLEIAFRPDPCIHDGRYANNGWLQELPRPLTKLTWDNAALMGPETARGLGIDIERDSLGSHTDVVEIRLGGRRVKAPAWIMPGHPEGSLTLHLGYGRTRAGRVGTGIGFNANTVRTSAAPWWAAGAEVRKTGERYRLACTQDHWSLEGRPVVRSASLEEYERSPSFAHEMAEEPPPELTLYPPHKYEGHAWGMSIDLNSCVGCNACMAACVSENNIPVVGKDQVGRGREMHWIRVDRYYSGDPAKPATMETHHQPVPCMHCENAPCEVVCPVAATSHSDEGLNDMVYNRCVGTKYCSNNCPYKVRRFNFFLYQDWDTPTFQLMRNPDVSVRSRGVMEKCSYCVQRIERVRIDARNQGREIRDGEIKTACQQACPGEAIVFGDVNDPQSRVSRLKAEPRNYGLLAELNTRPRTTYLASVRNPNPEIPRG